MQENHIRDALYNIANDSGADIEYAKGVLIGVVAVFTAMGVPFDKALDKALGLSPEYLKFRFACIPQPWREGLYVCKVDNRYHVRGTNIHRDYAHDHWDANKP